MAYVIKIRGDNKTHYATKDDVQAYDEAMGALEAGTAEKNSLISFSFARYIPLSALAGVYDEDSVNTMDTAIEEAHQRHLDAEKQWKEIAIQDAPRRAKRALTALGVVYPHIQFNKASDDPKIQAVQKIVLSWCTRHPYRSLVPPIVIKKIGTIIDRGVSKEAGLRIYALALSDDRDMKRQVYGIDPIVT